MNVKVITVLLAAALCMAMVPAVAATSPWIGNYSVTVTDNQPYGTFDGVTYDQNYFFGILGLCSEITDFAWSNDSRYSDRKYLEQVEIDDADLYPETINTTDAYEWKIVNSLDATATIYKKGLAGWADTSGMYYLWYGDRDAATGTYNNRDDWLFPTVENATYIIGLDVTVLTA